MRRRLWLTVLILYALAALADLGWQLVDSDSRGEPIGPASIAVAFAGGLFWPFDIVARLLLAR